MCIVVAGDAFFLGENFVLFFSFLSRKEHTSRANVAFSVRGGCPRPPLPEIKPERVSLIFIFRQRTFNCSARKVYTMRWQRLISKFYQIGRFLPAEAAKHRPALMTEVLRATSAIAQSERESAKVGSEVLRHFDPGAPAQKTVPHLTAAGSACQNENQKNLFFYSSFEMKNPSKT